MTSGEPLADDPRGPISWDARQRIGFLSQAVEAHHGPTASGLRYALSLAVLTQTIGASPSEKERGNFAEVANDPGAAAELEKELGAALRELVETLPQKARGLEPSIVDGDMLANDARFAELVERKGAAGKKLATMVRKESRERMAPLLPYLRWLEAAERVDDESRDDARREALRILAEVGEAPQAARDAWITDRSRLIEDWLPGDKGGKQPGPIPRFVFRLARVLWRDVVGPRLDEGRRKPPALVRAVAVDVLDLYSRRCHPEDHDGQRVLVFPEQRGRVIVPSLSDGTLASVLRRGESLLSSEIGIDLLEWQVTEAHRQYLADDRDFRHIVIEGGWSALAHEHLGYSSKRAPEQIREIVVTQAHARFDSQGITGNLLAYAEPRNRAPGQRSLVTLTLGDMLLYGYTHAMREAKGASSLSSREGRRLVPILGKATLVGRRNEYAAQRRMIWRFAVTLRDRAEELATDGAVRFTFDDWTTIASEAGMVRSGEVLTKVLDAWQAGDDATPPLIIRDGESVTLHASRKGALDFLVSGAKLSIRKRKDGVASARARAFGIRKRQKGAK